MSPEEAESILIKKQIEAGISETQARISARDILLSELAPQFKRIVPSDASLKSMAERQVRARGLLDDDPMFNIEVSGGQHFLSKTWTNIAYEVMTQTDMNDENAVREGANKIFAQTTLLEVELFSALNDSSQTLTKKDFRKAYDAAAEVGSVVDFDEIALRLGIETGERFAGAGSANLKQVRQEFINTIKQSLKDGGHDISSVNVDFIGGLPRVSIDNEDYGLTQRGNKFILVPPLSSGKSIIELKGL
jgi:hypothetical protein